MPKQTIGNPSKHRENLRGKWTGGGYAEPIEVAPLQSCDVCSSTHALRERTVDDERMVACIGCLKSAEANPSEWSKVTEPETIDAPVGKGLQRFATPNTSGDHPRDIHR